MAANGAVGVQGGNWQIFDQFVQRSGAKLLINTTVNHHAIAFPLLLI
jgi:prenylcysteine oxidase/farnesylcysteine lyase